MAQRCISISLVHFGCFNARRLLRGIASCTPDGDSSDSIFTLPFAMVSGVMQRSPVEGYEMELLDDEIEESEKIEQGDSGRLALPIDPSSSGRVHSYRALGPSLEMAASCGTGVLGGVTNRGRESAGASNASVTAECRLGDVCCSPEPRSGASIDGTAVCSTNTSLSVCVCIPSRCCTTPGRFLARRRYGFGGAGWLSCAVPSLSGVRGACPSV